MSEVKLYLFSQIPVGCEFTYETPNSSIIHKKISETQAVHKVFLGWADDSPRTISPSILVFPVHPFSLLSDRPQA